MRTRTLIVLALVTAVAVLAAGWSVATRRTAPPDMAGGPLFPGLAARINDVARLEVQAGGNVATIARGPDGAWIVEQKDGFRADPDQVKATILALAEALALEPRTVLPDLYPRIGVEDPDKAGASSARLRLTAADGREMAGLIIGKTASAAASTLYARKVGEAQSWLVRLALGPIEADPMRWTDASLPRIPADALAAVEIRQPDGRSAGIRRAAPGQPFAAFGADDVDPAVIDATAAMGSLFTAQDVARDDPALFTDAVVTEFHRFDGSSVVVRTVQRDGQFWVDVGDGWQYRVFDTLGRDLTRPPERFATEG